MTTTSTSFTGASLPPAYELEIGQALTSGSAFAKVSKRVELTSTGTVITDINFPLADWVGEGVLKPVKELAYGNITLVPKKMARVILFTDEALMVSEDKFRENLLKLVEEEGQTAFYNTFDNTIAGNITAPSGFSQMPKTGDKVITDYSSFISATSPINGKRASAIVLNLNLLYKLKGIVTQFGTPALQIVGDDKSGTIQGLHYEVFNDSVNTSPLGWVGAFDTQALWGIIPNSVKIEALTETAEVDGNVIALKQRNMQGVLIEAMFGFTSVNQYFAPISTAPAKLGK